MHLSFFVVMGHGRPWSVRHSYNPHFDWPPEMPFNHHWQDYRTRKDRSLKTVSDAGHTYDQPGIYTVCVKVVDVFGADTSITVEVEVLS